MADDIEDLARDGSFEPLQRLERQELQPKAKLRKKKEGTNDSNDSTGAIGPVGDNIPVSGQSIYIKTWGCAHNNSDGEYMAGALANYGYRITETPEDANMWILNSCTVKNPAQDHFTNTIKDARENNKLVVVAGCVPQAAPSLNDLQGLSMIGVMQIDRVVEVVEETFKGHTVRLMGQKKEGKKKLGGARLDMPKIRKNPLIEIVPISTGCLNACTYCKTKHARGQLGSYPIEEIVDRIKHVTHNEGVKEIWLTSEDTGAYGRDIDTNIVELLWSILDVLPEPVMLRLGMTNPPYIKEHLEDMAKIFHDPRIYAYLHCPIQAASDKVLDDMRREYTRADFEYIADYLKEHVPGICIATDLICGFPGETEEDWEETMDLVRKYQFSVLFINQFFPRPGTPAANMKRVPSDKVKLRTKAVSELFRANFPYSNRVGQRYSILVTEHAPDNVHYCGRTKAYEMVLVDPDPRFMGQVVDVEIVSTGKFYMEGKVLDECLARLPSVASSAFPSSSLPLKPTKEKAKITVFDSYGGHCEDPKLKTKKNDEAGHDHAGSCGTSGCGTSACGTTASSNNDECCGGGGAGACGCKETLSTSQQAPEDEVVLTKRVKKTSSPVSAPAEATTAINQPLSTTKQSGAVSEGISPMLWVILAVLVGFVAFQLL